MFGRTPKDNVDRLDDVMNDILDELNVTSPGSEEYPKLLGYLEKVDTMRKSKKDKRTISPDTIVLTVGNLLGIAIIVGFERGHAMTSKAYNYVLKSN